MHHSVSWLFSGVKKTDYPITSPMHSVMFSFVKCKRINNIVIYYQEKNKLFCRPVGIYSFPVYLIPFNPQFLPLFSDRTTARQKPQSDTLMGHEQKWPANKVHSGVNTIGQIFGVQAAMRDCIYQLGHSTVQSILWAHGIVSIWVRMRHSNL